MVILQVTPGDPLFAVGLTFFALGSILSVACPVRRVWALIPASGPATLGAHAPLAGRAWREEADRLSAELARCDTENIGLESHASESETI